MIQSDQRHGKECSKSQSLQTGLNNYSTWHWCRSRICLQTYGVLGLLEPSEINCSWTSSPHEHWHHHLFLNQLSSAAPQKLHHSWSDPPMRTKTLCSYQQPQFAESPTGEGEDGKAEFPTFFLLQQFLSSLTDSLDRKQSFSTWKLREQEKAIPEHLAEMLTLLPSTLLDST